MIKPPKTISILDAARVLNVPIGIIASDMGIADVRGNETLVTSDLLDRYKCPPVFFVECAAGIDRSLTKVQAAALLNVRPHSLNVFHKTRATIIPVLAFGDGYGRGHRYSRKTAEAHLALQAAQGFKVRKSPVMVAAKPIKRTAKRNQVQPAQAAA